MNDKPNSAGRAVPIAVFFTVFPAVFLLVVITTTLVTFILPETYASATRIRIDPQMSGPPGETNSTFSVSSAYDPHVFQTEFEVVQSEVVLRRVIEDLDLNTVWGRRYAGGERLKTTESLQLLKGRLDLRPVRGTSLLEVRVYSDDPGETAKLANAISASYLKSVTDSPRGVRAEVIDTAYPPLRPVRPNKPLNITLGVVVGIVLGLGCASFAAWISIGGWRRSGAAEFRR